jgi:CubicO group peptidase (beta-lactamase class C family)
MFCTTFIREQSMVTTFDELAREVREITVTETALRTYIALPRHLPSIRSSKGLEEGQALPEIKLLPGVKYRFDLEGFGNALSAALKNEVAGYVIRLRHHGHTIYTLDWNWAKTPTDGSEGWTPNVRMHVASCSKLVTAIAMTRLLHHRHISPDTTIISWLPDYWAKGPGVDQISFRNLMTHTSGFNTGGSDSSFNVMKTQVAKGVTTRGTYHYENMNFGLCRILLSTINGNVAPSAVFSLPFPPNSNDVIWDFVTINAYANYVRQHLFKPSDVVGPGFDHPAHDALAYTFPVSGIGWNSGDLSYMSGGAGWHMSADDLLNVMGTFRRKSTILSEAHAQQMLQDGFGIDLIQPTQLGTLYNKNGLWEDGSGHVEQSLAYFLPEHMEMVVLANSPIGPTNQFFRDVVTNIYTANIKPV